MGGREKKSTRDERYRENTLALADTVRIALKTAIDIGVPATAWAWTFWRVPWAHIGKNSADGMLNVTLNWPGAHFYTPTRAAGKEFQFDPLAYNGAMPGLGSSGIGDLVKVDGTEYKVTPYSDNLLYAARTELRDDILVALGPLFVLAIAPAEIGTAEKAAVGLVWTAAQFAAIELARTTYLKAPWEAWTGDGKARAGLGTLEYLSFDWLDRIAFSAQAPLLAHVLVRALQPGTD